ncbi:MAG TPA: hypothetical protein VFC51_17860 [Chloroflexota bacterium]|nr:hypothetical protein [Chloroflexota bacterium]
MPRPDRGSVWIVDLGLAGKVRPCLAARRRNEVDYWAARDRLLEQYRGQWIGFAEGQVIASGTSPVTVLHVAEASSRHPFVICVGHENEPCRTRRV